MLRAAALSKTYRARPRGARPRGARPRGARLRGRRSGRPIAALDRVDFAIDPASTVALVGPSGGGKSTLARCLALLEEPSSGEIWFDGQQLSALDRRQRRLLRPRIQLIFQDPAAAINPRFSALETVAEPLAIRHAGPRRRYGPRGAEPRDNRRQRALELMREVALPAELAGRSNRQLSGGQRQRLVIARALAAGPRMLILDEGLASLDLSLQAQIVNLLVALQERHGLAYLLISHDLRLAAHLADEIAVLDRGHIVERRLAADLLARPRHPASRELVGSLRPTGAVT